MLQVDLTHTFKPEKKCNCVSCCKSKEIFYGSDHGVGTDTIEDVCNSL